MAMMNFTDQNFQAEVLAEKGLVLVDFWAPWCAPCRMMGEVLEKLKIKNQKLKMGKVNVDEEVGLAQKYGVMSIPTLIFFKKGKEVKRLVGVRTGEEIVREISE
jgi:thioredoxin 1